jgi:hypothetical protein
LTFYTVVYLGMMAVEFFLPKVLTVPAGMLPVYITLVGAYAADKEIRRWVGVAEPPRKGSFFVYLWSLFFLVAFMVRTFRPEHQLPAELGLLTIQVLGIFFGSRASKGIYEWRVRPEDKDPQVISQRQARLLELLKTQGQVSNRDVAQLFGISSATTRRLLTEMESKGLICRQGEGKGTYFTLPPGK